MSRYQSSHPSMQWIEYPLFGPWPQMRAMTFTRSGGCSYPPFDTLNLSDRVGDDLKAVEENFAKIEAIAGRRIKTLHQVHGSVVVCVNKADTHLPPADALVTNSIDFGIGILHADCQAAVLFDPQKQVIGVVHSGWRGLVQNIYSSVVRTMREEYGCCLKDIRVVIAPSLGPCHAEFIGWKELFPKSFTPFHIGKNYFDLWAIGRFQLEQVGLLPEHIYVEETCTYCQCDQYFSYRKNRAVGRNLTLAFLQCAKVDFKPDPL